MDYEEFKNQFETIIFNENNRVLIVSEDFDNTINKLNKIAKEQNTKFSYYQFGHNTKKDNITISLSKNTPTDIVLVHLDTYKEKNIKGITYDFVIFDMKNNIPYDTSDETGFKSAPVYNMGWLKINNIEIPELTSFKVCLKRNKDENNKNKVCGIVEIKINFINYYIDNLILDKQIINMCAKYTNSNAKININNCRPTIEDVTLFVLNADKNGFVEKTYRFEFDLKDMKLE